MAQMKAMMICLILLKTLSCELTPYKIGTNYCFNWADFIQVRNNLDAIADYKSNIIFLTGKNTEYSNHINRLNFIITNQPASYPKTKVFIQGVAVGSGVTLGLVVALIIRSIFRGYKYRLF